MHTLTAGPTPLSLPSPPYGLNGPYAVSTWVKAQHAQHAQQQLDDGSAPSPRWQYIFTQSAGGAGSAGSTGSTTVAAGSTGGTAAGSSSMCSSLAVAVGAPGSSKQGVVRVTVQVRFRVKGFVVHMAAAV